MLLLMLIPVRCCHSNALSIAATRTESWAAQVWVLTPDFHIPLLSSDPPDLVWGSWERQFIWKYALQMKAL